MRVGSRGQSKMDFGSCSSDCRQRLLLYCTVHGVQQYHRRGKDALHYIPCPVPLTTSSSTQISLLHQMLLVAGLEMESRSRVYLALESPHSHQNSHNPIRAAVREISRLSASQSLYLSVRLLYYPFPFSFFYMSCALHAIPLYPVPFTTPSLTTSLSSLLLI